MWRHSSLCTVLLFSCLLLQPAQANDSPHKLAHDADLYLVPVGPVPADVMKSLAQRYRDIARLKVETVGQLPLPDEVVDPIRKQLIAEKLHDLMARVFGNWKHKPFSLVVGVTSYDMYIASSNWRYAYAYGQGQYALVSAGRMGDAESSDTHWSARVSTRVQKMLDKRIAIQHFGMGTSRSMPDVLSIPVLGPDDLDRINTQALTDVLSTASLDPDHQDQYTETQIAETVPVDPPIPWVIILPFAVGVTLILALIYKFAKKSEIAKLEEWRFYAEQRGWRFTRHTCNWFSSIPFSLEGELAGTPFTLHWHQKGSGKNVQLRTHLWLDIAVATPFQISPKGLFSGIFKRGRIKTGNRLYDCRFLVRTSDASWRLTAEISRRHLSMPVNILAQEEGLHLIHAGYADRQEAEKLIELARLWLTHLEGKVDAVPDQARSTASVLPCWIGKSASLAFWLYVGSSALLLFLIRGEETNLPWEIAWKWLFPVALVAWLVWVLWRLIWQRLAIRLVQEILAPPFFGLLIWGLTGPWIITWNAVSGDANKELVIGLVTDMRETSGKGGRSYFVEFQVAAEQRNVEILTNRETYERLRIGDPVGFDLRMGGLGMYHNTNPTLDSIRGWLDARD